MRGTVTILSAAAIATIASISAASAATPVLKGRWVVTYCEDINRTTCTTVCYAFTKVPDTVASNPNSGTWISNEGDGFAGQWSQSGDRVTFWGASTAGGMKTAIYFRGAFSDPKGLNGSRFMGYTVPNTNVKIGNWHADKVSKCPT
jgi:hypothetical protein